MNGEEGAPGQEPNPVVRVLATRTAQVGGVGLLALAGLQAALPPHRFLSLVPWGGALVTGGLSLYFAATFTARVPLGAKIMTRLPAGAGDAVALTFDDGPHPETTPRILDLLAAQDARATFFVLGEAVRRCPDLVRRIRGEGHGIGVHALHHRTMVLQAGRAIQADLCETLRRVQDAAPIPPGAPPVRLFRPPYGFKTVTVSRVANRLGLSLVAWSVDPRDYDSISADTLLARITARLKPGAIVLLHERPNTTRTLDVLPRLLRFCAERGWRCISLH